MVHGTRCLTVFIKNYLGGSLQTCCVPICFDWHCAFSCASLDGRIVWEGLINCAFITANWSHVRSAGRQRTCSSLIWGMGIPIGPMLIEQVPKDNVHVAEMDQ